MREPDPLPPSSELEQRARALLRAWRVVDAGVEVLWNERLTTTVGRAFVRRGRVELNPHLLRRAPDQLAAVRVHETAHVAAFRLFGEHVPAHGRHWRSLMRLAGHEPEVTHRIPLDGVRRRRSGFVYLRVCDACGDRVVTATVRYGRCQGCSRRDRYLVVRARANPAGRRALDGMSLAEVRAHFA